MQVKRRPKLGVLKWMNHDTNPDSIQTLGH